MATAKDYVARAEVAVRAVIVEQHAVVWPELEARLSDSQHQSASTPLDPNHVTTAASNLLKTGVLDQDYEVTRGGRAVRVLSPSDRVGRERAIDDAAARKRLLYARYLGWAMGTAGRPSYIGRALEQVTHNSILAAAPHVGYRLENPTSGQARSLLGVELPGPLDNACSFIDPATMTQYVFPIEAKNVREWLFPSTPEVYQLLLKASVLQNERPSAAIVPVLVCRRAHKTLIYMAKMLGFHVIDVRRQYILPHPFETDAGAKKLTEVRAELSFLDLLPGDETDKVIVKQFAQSLPARAEEASAAWRTLGSIFYDDYLEMIRATNRPDRLRALNAIRDGVRLVMDQLGTPVDRLGW